MRGTGCTARPPRAVSANTSNNWFRASRAHCTAASLSSHDDGEDDHLVKNAAELAAETHVADSHEVGADHTGQLGERSRLADLAQAAQSIMPIMHIMPISLPMSMSLSIPVPMSMSIQIFMSMFMSMPMHNVHAKQECEPQGRQ